jgi:hypothetical protein
MINLHGENMKRREFAEAFQSFRKNFALQWALTTFGRKSDARLIATHANLSSLWPKPLTSRFSDLTAPFGAR